MLYSIKVKLREKISQKLIPLQKRLDRLVNANWYEWPFGRDRNASKEYYLSMANTVQNQSYPDIEKFE